MAHLHECIIDTKSAKLDCKPPKRTSKTKGNCALMVSIILFLIVFTVHSFQFSHPIWQILYQGMHGNKKPVIILNP